MKSLWNCDWAFALTPVGTSLADAQNAIFSPVELPHDWLIADANALYASGFGWYRKRFCNRGAECVRVYFEGVYQDCTVYLNGVEVGENKYGYSSFCVELTQYLQAGENELLVLVRHEAPNSRWYSGAGIFRDVWLLETSATHFVEDGIYFHAQKTTAGWQCQVSAEYVGDATVQMQLSHQDVLLYQGRDLQCILPDETSLVWDIEHPTLLTLTVQLCAEGTVMDTISQSVGLREIAFDPDCGFLLNGRAVKLHGVCLHHDLGAFGAAFQKEAARRQLLTMKEMGANAVRTSHNMPAKAFMELCDELGMLVDSEAFDMWERPKTEFDYARFFPQWFAKDVAAWVRRDRNHPSVIMWSVGNEIYDTHLSARGCEVAKRLHDAVREHDPLQNAYTTIGSNYMPWENAQHCAEQVDLVGYNYGENCYALHHAQHPKWCIYGSETTAGVKSRGIYHFPLDMPFLTHDDLQCSSLGNCRGGFTADTAQAVIGKDAAADFCAGMFIWTGSDYIGEPSPYATKNAYYGCIDTAGLKKDQFYLYQAAWTNQPVLHLLPFWDFNEGQLVDVVALTNLQSVELFVNGVSVGKHTPQQYVASWQVPYHAGAICVRGYDAQGVLHEDIHRSFGDSYALVLVSHTPVLQDLAAVTISVTDAEGNPVENARDRVRITVEGGRLVGFDNGDSTDYDSYHSNCRKLFSGKAVAWVAVDGKAESVIIRAEAPNLRTAELQLPVSSIVDTDPAIYRRRIAMDAHNGEIPVRKIALHRNGSTLLTPDAPTATITAEILPANASYNDLQWKVVTASGIVTNIAMVNVTGNIATVAAVGDGAFRLRCSCDNGKPQAEVISDFEFTAEGFGQPFTDPYQAVTGCFYEKDDAVLDEVAAGAVIVTDAHHTIGFTKLDFGRYGSDHLTVQLLHWFSDKDVTFTLWDGHPDRSGKQIGAFTYHATFLWQTFQSNSYRLKERLCGVHDLYFRFGAHSHRLDFGAFCFQPVEKAYETIAAAHNDLVHGDTFTVNGDAVCSIGNNVFIDFEDMDFTRGVAAIELIGRTRHDHDSVHMYIANAEHEVRTIIEFPFSEDIITVRQKVADFRGQGTVKFCFLPGCDFDFAAFRLIPAEQDTEGE